MVKKAFIVLENDFIRIGLDRKANLVQLRSKPDGKNYLGRALPFFMLKMEGGQILPSGINLQGEELTIT